MDSRSGAFFSGASRIHTQRGGGKTFTFASRGSMPKPSRWTAEKRYEIITEILKGKETITHIARKHQVSDALIHRWRERFYEGGKAALNFEVGAIAVSRSREQALEQKIEELEKVIGQQTVEIRFLKKLSAI